MKKAMLPSYSQLQKALEQITLDLHPSEFHGLVCGALCGGIDNVTDSLIEFDDGALQYDEHAWQVLNTVYDTTAVLLKTFSLELTLILPDDRYSLSKRAAAIAIWCQGFLTGLQFASAALLTAQDEEVVDILASMGEITRIQHVGLVTNEQNEADYIEIVEYVRMSVIFLYQSTTERPTAVIASSAEKNTGQLH